MLEIQHEITQYPNGRTNHHYGFQHKRLGKNYEIWIRLHEGLADISIKNRGDFAKLQNSLGITINRVDIESAKKIAKSLIRKNWRYLN